MELVYPLPIFGFLWMSGCLHLREEGGGEGGEGVGPRFGYDELRSSPFVGVAWASIFSDDVAVAPDSHLGT